MQLIWAESAALALDNLRHQISVIACQIGPDCSEDKAGEALKKQAILNIDLIPDIKLLKTGKIL